MTEYCGKI